MTPEQFAYWLQGYVELIGNRPSEARWKAIKEHLATVFVKVTPEVGQKPPKSPDDKCGACGNPREPHRYRHPFKEPEIARNEIPREFGNPNKDFQEIMDAIEDGKIPGLGAPPAQKREMERENRKRLAELIGPFRTCTHDQKLC
jgi:hypothetical protein